MPPPPPWLEELCCCGPWFGGQTKMGDVTATKEREV